MAGVTLVQVQPKHTVNQRQCSVFNHNLVIHRVCVLTPAVALGGEQRSPTEGPEHQFPVCGADGRPVGLRLQWLCRRLL